MRRSETNWLQDLAVTALAWPAWTKAVILLISLLLVGASAPGVFADDADGNLVQRHDVYVEVDETVPPLVRNLFRMFGVPVRGEEQQEPPAADISPKDPVDARVPRDVQVDDLWEASQKEIQNGKPEQALELLQRLLDLPEDAVVPTQPGRWESARASASRLVGSLSPAILTDYENRYGKLARQMLDQARLRNDRAEWVSVATRYFHTRAGAEAAAQIALWHLDQQEYVAATWWNRQLLARNWPGCRNRAWQLSAGLAARLAGASDVEEFLADARESSQAISIGGKRTSIREWWEQLPAASSMLLQPHQWKEFGGSPSRGAGAPDGLPLLVAEWSQPLSSVLGVQRRLKNLLKDLKDANVPLIPVASPIVLDQTVAFRDLRGVQMVDLSTGRVLWRTEEGVSPERILQGVPAANSGIRSSPETRLGTESFDSEYQGESAEMHPLATWLFRDAANGQISSDGQRLFVLEDVAVMTRHQSGEGDDSATSVIDSFGVEWGSNRLTAYDVVSGRQAWTVGGPKTPASTTVPLEGNFFLGVPLAFNDELFVVAAAGQEIRLQVLDPATGAVRWSQLLAFSDTKIELDIVRRWLNAPVAISEGVVVCPTTVGWLIAVDRVRRSLLWAHRYADRNEDSEFEPTSQFLFQKPLDNSWSPCAPLIIDGMVVWGSPDAETFSGMRLIDGQKVWEHDRNDGLYLAAGGKGRILRIHTKGVDCLDVQTGDNIWSQSISGDSQVCPSGRGCLIGHRWAMPLSDGTLLFMNRETGAIEQRLDSVPGEPPLGNLVKVKHDLLSVGPEGVRLFREREAVLQQLAQPAKDVQRQRLQRLQAAELALAENRPRDAVTVLEEIEEGEGPAVQRERRSDLLRLALNLTIHSQPEQGDEWLMRMSRLASTPRQKFAVEASRIEWLQQRHETEAALDKVWELLKKGEGPEYVPSSENSYVEVERITWLSGVLERLWEASQGPERERIHQRFMTEIDQALAGDVGTRVQQMRWLRFHPSASRIAWMLADDWAAASQFFKAETELLAWVEHEDLAIRIESQLRLARLWKRFGVSDDAAELTKRVLATVEPRALRLSTGEEVHEAVQQWELMRGLTPPVSALDPVRQTQKLVAHSTSAVRVAERQPILSPLNSSYFADLLVDMNNVEQKVTFQSRRTGEWEWVLPLREGQPNSYYGNSSCEILGHSLFTFGGEILQVISPVRKERPWSTAVGVSPLEDQAIQREMPSEMFDTSTADIDSIFWTFRESGRQQFSACLPSGLVMTGRRGVEVFETQTGRLRWSLGNISPYVTVLATSKAVFVVDHTRETANAFRMSDGFPLEIENLRQQLLRTVTVIGSDLITLSTVTPPRLFGLTPGRMAVSRHNPVMGKSAWTVQLAEGAKISRLGHQQLLTISPSRKGRKADRTVEVINLETGARQLLDGLPYFEEEENMTAVIDRERLYLIVNHGQVGNYSYGDSLATSRIHGTFCVWERASGKMLWKRAVENQYFVLNRFEESPVLLFLAREGKQIGMVDFSMLQLLALDKQTGNTLHESSTPSQFGGFHGVQLLAPEGEVELTSFNSRLRLAP